MFSVPPAHAVASITADSGSEFAFNYIIADTIGVSTYLGDPYSSFRRGTSEHFNGRIRRYLPEGTVFMMPPRKNVMSMRTRSTTGPGKRWAG